MVKTWMRKGLLVALCGGMLLQLGGACGQQIIGLALNIGGSLVLEAILGAITGTTTGST